MASRLITGLDLGSTKICATQARVERDGRVVLLGSTAIPSSVLAKGIVPKLEPLITGIRKVVHQLEEKTGQHSYAAVFNVSGDYLSLQQSQSSLFLSERGVEISTKDAARVIESAQQMSLTFERQNIHAVS